MKDILKRDNQRKRKCTFIQFELFICLQIESDPFLPMSPEDWEWIMSVTEGANRGSDGKEPSPATSLPGPYPREPQDWNSSPPPWAPRTPSGPIAPTPLPPSPKPPARSAPMVALAALVPPPPAPVCNCLIEQRNFCNPIRELAGEEGLTEDLLHTRSRKEVLASNHSELKSGGLASRGNPSSEPWQSENLASGSKDVVQVVNLIKSSIGSDVVQVVNCNISSANDSLVQVDNCYSLPPTDGVVQADINCYNVQPCDVDQVENLFNRPNVKGHSVAQVDNIFNMSPTLCDIKPVENSSIQTNVNSLSVAQVENCYVNASTSVDQVDKLFIRPNVEGQGIVQVDNLLIQANVNGQSLVQVENLCHNASAHCDNTIQPEKVIHNLETCAHSINLV